ncbi:hypothetical protein EYF80_013424 [Liparis tanakae]|uniref:Uncharacterized protein n=1 Tax=Liparis tanakae TaxID=230148 RepID=A0A4Z2IFH2_9TELE|nr:hypothetical protein EYF80_013424 [Liparis tanakae]
MTISWGKLGLRALWLVSWGLLQHGNAILWRANEVRQEDERPVTLPIRGQPVGLSRERKRRRSPISPGEDLPQPAMCLPPNMRLVQGCWVKPRFSAFGNGAAPQAQQAVEERAASAYLQGAESEKLCSQPWYLGWWFRVRECTQWDLKPNHLLHSPTPLFDSQPSPFTKHQLLGTLSGRYLPFGMLAGDKRPGPEWDGSN